MSAGVGAKRGHDHRPTRNANRCSVGELERAGSGCRERIKHNRAVKCGILRKRNGAGELKRTILNRNRLGNSERARASQRQSGTFRQVQLDFIDSNRRGQSNRRITFSGKDDLGLRIAAIPTGSPGKRTPVRRRPISDRRAIELNRRELDGESSDLLGADDVIVHPHAVDTGILLLRHGQRRNLRFTCAEANKASVDSALNNATM